MLELILEKDTELFLFLNSLGNPNWDLFWKTITNKKTWIPLYIFILGFIYFKTKNGKYTLFVLVASVLLVGLNDSLANLFKDGFARYRPCRVPEIMNNPSFRLIKDYCGTYGYFSAHAANHFAIALFLGTLLKSYWKWARVILFIWAGFIAYSRIYIGVHYPLDVLTGITIGVFTGLFFLKIKNSYFKRYF